MLRSKLAGLFLVLGPLGTGCVVHATTDPNAPPIEEETDAALSVGASVSVGSPGEHECHGNDSRVIEDQTIDRVGTVVEAHGNCRLTLRRVRILGDVGLEAHGNASVVVEDSTIEGRQQALEVHGNATVQLKNTVVLGAIDRHGNGSIDDQGGNTLP